MALLAVVEALAHKPTNPVVMEAQIQEVVAVVVPTIILQIKEEMVDLELLLSDIKVCLLLLLLI
jgi:hypothetical protein